MNNSSLANILANIFQKIMRTLEKKILQAIYKTKGQMTHASVLKTDADAEFIMSLTNGWEN